MSERLETAKKVNAILRLQKTAVEGAIPDLMERGLSASGSDEAQGRKIAGDLGAVVDMLVPFEWAVSMKTNPGDVVYDPEKQYRYLYSGKEPMQHDNPLFYPGSVGVYYWAIIPNIKDGFKVYPEIDGIVVSVKTGEVWWDTKQENKYRWKGADNPNCVWPPAPGNEWEAVN